MQGYRLIIVICNQYLMILCCFVVQLVRAEKTTVRQWTKKLLEGSDVHAELSRSDSRHWNMTRLMNAEHSRITVERSMPLATAELNFHQYVHLLAHVLSQWSIMWQGLIADWWYGNCNMWLYCKAPCTHCIQTVTVTQPKQRTTCIYLRFDLSAELFISTDFWLLTPVSDLSQTWLSW